MHIAHYRHHLIVVMNEISIITIIINENKSCITNDKICLPLSKILGHVQWLGRQ